ncbi:MAG TPA: helix-turn-helix domain-containing protein [Jiangellaceae bacterium]|nr:helix-turn-helix domain-containing protein [Jiangellaceae bacterium]
MEQLQRPGYEREGSIGSHDQEVTAVLLRVEEAAQRLGIARTLMYQLVRTGEVESVCVGRLRRIPVECLQDYVDDLRTRPGQSSSRGVRQ